MQVKFSVILHKSQQRKQSPKRRFVIAKQSFEQFAVNLRYAVAPGKDIFIAFIIRQKNFNTANYLLNSYQLKITDTRFIFKIKALV